MLGIPGRNALSAGLLLAGLAGQAQAQGFLDKLSKAANSLRAATIESSLNRVRTTDLEGRGLPTLPMGSVSFGVAGVESLDSVGLRLHVYLYNAGAQDATLALPPGDGFTLVDARGRRVESVGGVRWKGLARGATSLTVPALERISGTLVFGPPGSDGGMGALKVAGAGVIGGIPVSAAALAGGVPEAASSWTAPGPSQSSGFVPTASYPATQAPQAPVYPQATPSPQTPAYPQATPSPQPPAYPQPSAYPQAPAYPQASSAAAGLWTATTTRGPLQLELRPDGSYDLGGVVGSYEVTGSQVVFRGGPVAAWGSGTAVLSADQLTFAWQNADGTPGQLTLARTH